MPSIKPPVDSIIKHNRGRVNLTDANDKYQKLSNVSQGRQQPTTATGEVGDGMDSSPRPTIPNTINSTQNVGSTNNVGQTSTLPPQQPAPTEATRTPEKKSFWDKLGDIFKKLLPTIISFFSKYLGSFLSKLFK